MARTLSRLVRAGFALLRDPLQDPSIAIEVFLNLKKQEQRQSFQHERIMKTKSVSLGIVIFRRSPPDSVDFGGPKKCNSHFRNVRVHAQIPSISSLGRTRRGRRRRWLNRSRTKENEHNRVSLGIVILSEITPRFGRFLGSEKVQLAFSKSRRSRPESIDLGSPRSVRFWNPKSISVCALWSRVPWGEGLS